LFWEYDSRLGRRWNIDPVVKPALSGYSAFSNSPIWKVDPDGDDDFFNTSGKFLRRTAGGSAIRIVDGKQTQLFSAYLSNKSYGAGNRANTALGIANHYATQAGVKGKVELEMNMNNPNSPAHESGGTVKINAFLSPKNYKHVSDFGNVTNILKHEAGHQAEKVKLYSDHAKVYLGQILDKSFTEGTTKEYRDATVASFVNYTMNSFVQDPNSAESIEIMETFNKENKAGYTLSTSGGLGNAKSLEVNINTKDGTSTKKYEKMSDPN
jgi:hypothetical protein